MDMLLQHLQLLEDYETSCPSISVSDLALDRAELQWFNAVVHAGSWDSTNPWGTEFGCHGRRIHAPR